MTTLRQFDLLNIYVDNECSSNGSSLAVQWDPTVLTGVPFKEGGFQLLDCPFITLPKTAQKDDGCGITGIPGAFR
jgi:hypothetical protein